MNASAKPVDTTVSNPVIGVERLKETLDATFKAMDPTDTFRSKAIESMGRNNEMMKGQVQRAGQYLDRSRGGKARQALAADAGQAELSGPVAL
jgi:Toxic anion resistance protein (TelA)